MKKTVKILIVFIGVVTILFILTKAIGHFRLRTASKSLAMLIPLLENERIRAIRYQDWCQVLSYRRGSYANRSESTCTFIAVSPPKLLDDTANEDLQRFWKKIEGRNVKLSMIYDTQFDSDGNLIFGRFECDKLFSRQRYVFDPGYKLPVNIPREKYFKKINKDWYFVIEDWN